MSLTSAPRLSYYPFMDIFIGKTSAFRESMSVFDNVVFSLPTIFLVSTFPERQGDSGLRWLECTLKLSATEFLSDSYCSQCLMRCMNLLSMVIEGHLSLLAIGRVDGIARFHIGHHIL